MYLTQLSKEDEKLLNKAKRVYLENNPESSKIDNSGLVEQALKKYVGDN